MKPLRRTLFAVLGEIFALVITANGQTNTFPSNGSVGIGTTSPVAGTLSIVESSGNDPIAWQTGSAGTWQFGSNAGVNTNDEIVGLFSYTYSSSHGTSYQPMQIWNSSNSTISLLLSGGNVGIGTTTPIAPLDITDPLYAGLASLELHDSQAIVAGSGGGLFLGGIYSGSTYTEWAGLKATKDNGTSGNYAGGLDFYTRAQGAGPTVSMSITSAGDVGIGTRDPAYPLSVNGTVEAKEVIVQTGWSDYVFAKGYHLAPLGVVEKAIKAQGHLPGMPSAKEVAAHGVGLGEMQARLLAQVEQLTLHVIEQEKLLAEQEQEITALKATVNSRKDNSR